MKIIGLSGKKQSGKNTVANIISGIALKKIDLINDFELDNNGKLLIHCAEGVGELDLYRKDAEFVDYAHRFIWPYVKIYSFADDLKKMCIDLFEIPEECVYGTDDEKNKIQEHLLWENMPGLLDEPKRKKWSGPMTAREFMQFFGTEIMRKMYESVWTERTIKNIKTENPQISVISDCRFKNEALAMKEQKAKLIYLTRSISKDSHSSENGFEDFDDFDAVIDNQNMTIEETTIELMKIIESWGWLGDLITKEDVRKGTKKIKK